jgi:hypothetical protein
VCYLAYASLTVLMKPFLVLRTGRIAAICKPHVFQDTVPSDWSLLKAQRIRQASATQFYLQHNYIDMMRYMGYSTAACRVVDAAVSSSKSRAMSGSGSGRESGNGSADGTGTGVGVEGQGKEGTGLSSNMVLAAVLVAGGVMSYGLLFSR